MMHVLDDTWLPVYFSFHLCFLRNTKREKKWFERRGQGKDGEEGGGEEQWCWPEGEDPMSLLPREVAVRVRT